MMRLLKYDWNRNATTLLIAAVVLAVAELLLELFGHNEAAGFTLMILGYVAISVMIIVISVKTYSRNIISYSRRLLPVRTIYHILSPLLLGLLATLLVDIVFLLHNGLREQAGVMSLFNWVDETAGSVSHLSWGEVTLVAAGGFWMVLVQLLALFTSVTIGRSFRTKGQAWIMLISYLVIQNGISLFIESLLNLPKFGWFEIIMTSDQGMGYSSDPYKYSDLYSSIAIEAAFCLLMITGMVMLLNRRVEVK
ncbi:hypothetical protein [Paenibacillus caui]|uniref:hypothetical protein n=1 Tax=Paenibacillus caui TaxID=2873927 RepID=UPI001CA8620A|nr:hypothetical protein [Paenibacillus caui]